MKDGLKISGKLIITRRIGDRIIDVTEFDNKVTDLGATLFAQRITGSGTGPSHMGIGTGYTPAAAGDTALESQSARVALAATTYGTKLVQWTATFPAGTATGTMREFGLFNAASNGTMTNRAVPTTPMVKTAAMSIDVVWQMTLSN